MKKLLLFFVLSLFTRHAFAAPFEAPIIFRKVISNSVGSVVLGDRDQGIVAYFRSRGWLYTPNHETVNKVNTQSFQTDVINPQAPDLLPNSYPENLIAADKNSSYWATTFHRQTNPSSWSENDILFQFYNGAELIYETILPLGSDYNANCHNMKFVDLAESATKRLIMLCRVGSTENIVVVDYNENPSPGDEQVNINYKAINHAVMYGNAISEKGTIAMVEGSQLKIIDVTSNSQGTIEFKQFGLTGIFFLEWDPTKWQSVMMVTQFFGT